jgi:hypothetical protein
LGETTLTEKARKLKEVSKNKTEFSIRLISPKKLKKRAFLEKTRGILATIESFGLEIFS